MKVVLITGHEYDSPRKTGFHFWADILSERGDQVDFLTVGQSKMTGIIGNHKVFPGPHNEWVFKKTGLRKFVWMPLFHPFKLKLSILTRLSTPFFSWAYPAMLPKKFKDGVKDADAFIVEVGAGLLLVKTLHKLCPNARFIYTVSDRLSTLNAHPALEEAEKKVLPLFSRIRVPAAMMAEDYVGYKVKYIAQGIDKNVFVQRYASPYTKPKNAVSVGDMLFDSHAIETMAQNFPDWTFHVFGRRATVKNPKPNIICYGEKPFDQITPYIQNADIALAPYRNEASAAYLSQSSLKMFQYSYCALPIVAPSFAAVSRDHAIGYDPDDPATIVEAFQKAMDYDRSTIDTDNILDWNQVIDKMLAN